MTKDIIIIGGGVSGAALARVLSRYEADIAVVERGPDLASGASRANSGIVHAGFDAVPGSLKAKYNVLGSQMYPALAAELGVPYEPCGALVLGFSEEDRKTLQELLEQGEKNGVPGLRILERDEILEMEPNVSPEVQEALYAPSSGIVSPYEMTYALAEHAARNGVEFFFDTDVKSVTREDGLWHLDTNHGEMTCRVFVNCAGIDGGRIHNQVADRKVEIIPRRGQYYLLDRLNPLPFSRTVFQCPTVMGKGVLVSPTVHGNMLLGPSAEDIPDGWDTRTTADVLESVLKTSRITWPNSGIRSTITNFAGVRAHEAQGDFVIGKAAECAYSAVGIESPGISAAPAFAEALGSQIAEEQGLVKKENVLPPVPKKKSFHEMTTEERQQVVAENPLYGNVICRCEQVTEAEIREAIRRPVGATTIDGVKRRTRAGMGRCQGGFCSPRVAQILAEELHVPLTEITKNGKGSELLTGTVADAMRKGVQA